MKTKKKGKRENRKGEKGEQELITWLNERGAEDDEKNMLLVPKKCVLASMGVIHFLTIYGLSESTKIMYAKNSNLQYYWTQSCFTGTVSCLGVASYCMLVVSSCTQCLSQFCGITVKPLGSNINLHVLLTVIRAFRMVLIGWIWLNIKINYHNWCSFPLFRLWPVHLIE